MFPSASTVVYRSSVGSNVRATSISAGRCAVPIADRPEVHQDEAGDCLVAEVRAEADPGGLGQGVQRLRPTPRLAAPSQDLRLREQRAPKLLAQFRPEPAGGAGALPRAASWSASPRPR